MTIDVANAGRYVFYLNFRTVGDGTNFAIANQEFTFSNLIEDSSKYAISVERFRLPIHTIPMFPAENNVITLIRVAPGAPVTFNLEDSYSILDFIQKINAFIPGTLTLSLSDDARILLNFTDNVTYNELILSQSLANIFDTPTNFPFVIPFTVLGSSPIPDRFDQLSKVQIEAKTGLASIQQEIVTTAVFQNLVTDFILPSSFTMSYMGRPGTPPNLDYTLSFPIRQDLEFNAASDRRIIMLKGNAPVQNIQLEMAAIYRDGSRNRIRLPPNGVMEIKIAFWKKE